MRQFAPEPVSLSTGRQTKEGAPAEQAVIAGLAAGRHDRIWVNWTSIGLGAAGLGAAGP